MSEATVPILLVEDSPTDARLVRQVLSRSGRKEWELVCVERLSEAIAACRDRLFSVVLLDLSLPDSDRENTVSAFCRAVPEVPVVVLTMSDDEELGLQSVANGAQDYLVKDQLTMQTFVRTIRYTLERGYTAKQLRESERRFRAIFNQTFQMIGLLRPDGTLLEANQTALDFVGVCPEEVVGCPFWETRWWNISRETQNHLQGAIAKAAQGTFVRYEVDIKAAQDQLVTVDFSLKPVRNEQGQVVLLIAEGRDISDRKRAEAEVLKALEKERELNQLKSSFVSMVSHEFRTPMTVIQMAVELLQSYSDNLTKENKGKYFTQIRTAISDMLQLLDEVLFLGRTDADRLEFQPAPLDLENFCRKLVANMQISTNTQHTITFTCVGGTPSEMDAFLLQLILTNLLSNAIKYSPPGSNIRFNLSYQGATALLQIQDQGIGIPMKDQTQLFETFYRASNVGQVQGTGLGLSIVKKCVELHNGQISLESEVGFGTTVTITLPLKPLNIV